MVCMDIYCKFRTFVTSVIMATLLGFVLGFSLTGHGSPSANPPAPVQQASVRVDQVVSRR